MIGVVSIMKKKAITALALGAAAVSAGMTTNNVSANNVATSNSQVEASAKNSTKNSTNQAEPSSNSQTKNTSVVNSNSTVEKTSVNSATTSNSTTEESDSNSAAKASTSIENQASSQATSGVAVSSKSDSSTTNSASSKKASSSSKKADSSSKDVKSSSDTTASSSEANNSKSSSVNSETAGYQAHGTKADKHNIPAMIKKEAAQNKEKFNQQLSNPDARAAYDKLNADAKEVAQAANIDLAKLTHQEIDALNSVKMDSTPESGTVTYTDYADIAKDLIDRNPQYAVPQFNPSDIKNFPAATTADAETGKVESLDVWDSWPVMDANTGAVTNWNGYELVFGMAGKPQDWHDNHLYLFYTKYGDNNFDDWKCAGPVFGPGQNPIHQRWSGSACVNSDGTIQLYYTDVDTSTGHNNQKLATVTLTLKDDNNQVSIVGLQNEKILFAGDGKLYQTFAQFEKGSTGIDNFCLRDPHIFVDNGKRYLVFEGSTGSDNYQGMDQIYNLGNYGGATIADDVNDMFQIINSNDMTARGSYANAAIGILELGGSEKNPTVVKVDTPLIQAPLATDEIERPDIIKINGKYYLFADARLNRGTNDPSWQAADKTVGDNVIMLGFVSDHLTYGYKPLNGTGVVLTASTNANSRTATYAYYAVPILGKDGQPTNYVLITDYMTNRGWVAGEGNNTTWGPSFVVEIMPDGTTRVVPGSVTKEQGVWVLGDTTELAPVYNGSAVKVVNKTAGIKKNSTDGQRNAEKVYYDVQKHKLIVSNTIAAANKVQADTVQSVRMANKANANKNVKRTSGNRLPQTGETTSNKTVWGMISVVMASILAAFGFADKKRRG